MKMTMKACMVLGLILAVSTSAQALSWNANGAGYTGPINIKFDFVSSSYTYVAGDPVPPAMIGRTIQWGIYKVKTVERGDNVPATKKTIWNETWGLNNGNYELAGIIYKLEDQAVRDFLNPLDLMDLFGNGLQMELYELIPTSFDNAVVNGTGGWGGAGSEGTFAGLTDQVIPGESGPAIAGAGSGLIVVPAGTTALDGVSPSPIALADQMTRVNVIDMQSDGSYDIADVALGGVYMGTSVAYLDWTGGYELDVLISSAKADWGPAPPGSAAEVPAGSFANARTTQTFNASIGTLAAAGWQFDGLSNDGGFDTLAAIPEPVTMIALFSGIVGLGGYIRKRRSA